MNNRKLKFIILPLLVITLISILALAGCNKETLGDIYIPKNDSPRVVYVEGQDLDLSKGSLTVVINGEETSVPLNSADVTISGYNKDQVGKQTLTVSYKEKSISLEVTVIARLVAEGFENNYFIGDVFNATKGKLKLARDNGTTFTVNINEKGVEIVEFNSSKEGMTDVKVKYTANDGKVYEGSFSVKIHGIGEVKFKRPYKTEYASHDTTVEVAGAGFTVTSSSDSSFQKNVLATPDMVTGFDPSKATIDNRDVPLNQTLIFSYAGKEFELPITITFSPLSILNEKAELLKDVDWDGENISITTEIGEASLDAINQYYKLTDGEIKLVDEEVINNVARVAAIYATTQYKKAAEADFGKVLTISNNGQFSLAFAPFDEFVTARDNLENADSQFNNYAKLLRNIKADFGEVNFKGEAKIANVIAVNTEEDRFYLIDILNHLIDLHGIFSEIDSDLVLDGSDPTVINTLIANKDAIEDAVTTIRESAFVGVRYSFIYSILTGWRENSDYFDIIYYYYFYSDDIKSLIGEELFSQVMLPIPLENWFISINNAIYEEQYMLTYMESQAYLRDTTNFMYYYFETIELANKVKNGENKFYKELYEHLTGDILFDQYLTSASVGYIYQCGTMLDSERFNSVWNTYLKLYDLYYTSAESIDLERDGHFFEDTFAAIADLSPTELNAFLCSLNFLYGASAGNILVLDYSDGVPKNMVIFLLVNYYMNVVSENAIKPLQPLLCAMENYSLIGIKETALEDFKTSMQALENAINALSTEERIEFMNAFGTAYSKYSAIYAEELATVKAEPSESLAASFEELYSLLLSMNDVLKYLGSLTEEDEMPEGIQSILFAIFERIAVVHDDLIKVASAADLTVLSTKQYTFGEGSTTLEKAFYNARGIYLRYMIYASITVTDPDGVQTSYRAWDKYKETTVNKYLAKLAHLFVAAFKNTAYEGNDVLEIMRELRALSEADISMFVTVGAHHYYYGMLSTYFGELIPDSSELINKFFECEIYYIYYLRDANEENLETFKTKLEAALSAYEGAKDNATVAEYFGEMLEHYSKKLAEIEAERTPTGDSTEDAQ